MSYRKRVRSDFWETFCFRYDAGEKFNEDELNYMAYDCVQKDEIEGDEHRWTRDVETIFECDNRCFSIVWSRGLTEYQCDEFYSQPEEVVLHEYDKLVKVREWVTKKSIDACAFKEHS